MSPRTAIEPLGEQTITTYGRGGGGVMIGSVEVVAAQAMSSFVAIKLDISIPTQPPRMGVTVIPALGPVPAAPPDQGTVRASRVQAGAGAGINSC